MIVVTISFTAEAKKRMKCTSAECAVYYTKYLFSL